MQEVARFDKGLAGVLNVAGRTRQLPLHRGGTLTRQKAALAGGGTPRFTYPRVLWVQPINNHRALPLPSSDIRQMSPFFATFIRPK